MSLAEILSTESHKAAGAVGTFAGVSTFFGEVGALGGRLCISAAMAAAAAIGYTVFAWATHKVTDWCDRMLKKGA
jgi:hypothetical protein